MPVDVVEALGGGRRAKVVVTLGGPTYRSSLASMGGQVLISPSAEHGGKAGVFEALSYSGQRRRAEPIAAAKASDTRVRRVRKVLDELAGGCARAGVGGRPLHLSGEYRGDRARAAGAGPEMPPEPEPIPERQTDERTPPAPDR